MIPQVPPSNPVGAIMAINKLIWSSVGADLSALAGFSDITLNLLNFIIWPLLYAHHNVIYKEVCRLVLIRYIGTLEEERYLLTPILR